MFTHAKHGNTEVGGANDDATTDATTDAASAAPSHGLDHSVWQAGGLGRDATVASEAIADALLDASGTTDAATYAKTTSTVKGLIPQYCSEMLGLYTTQGVRPTDVDKTLLVAAFLSFKSWKDYLGYDVLLIIGSALQLGPSSAELRANITAYVKSHGGKVIIATDGNETVDGEKPGANELASEIAHELKDGDFPGVKYCVFTPQWNIATGILTGTKKGMQVDVAIALQSDKVFITNKEGGAEIGKGAMIAICAGVGADVGCFEGGWGNTHEYESAFKRRKCGEGCNNLSWASRGKKCRTT